MKIEIELNEDEKKQAFLDYCWKNYGLESEDVNVYAALGQITYYFYPEKEEVEIEFEEELDIKSYQQAKDGE